MSKRWADYSDDDDDTSHIFVSKFKSMISGANISESTMSIIISILEKKIDNSQKEIMIEKIAQGIGCGDERILIIEIIDKIRSS